MSAFVNKLKKVFYHWRRGELLYVIVTRNLLRNHNQDMIHTAKSVGNRFRNHSLGSMVNGNTVIGDDVSFNEMAIRGKGEAYIGNHFHCGTGCTIITSNHDYDHGELLPYGRMSQVLKRIVIEDNVWFGANVTVLGNATIGEGAIIQAGALVIGDIPPLAIAGGVPAKVFKYRDKEHYETLKKEGKFFVLGKTEPDDNL